MCLWQFYFMQNIKEDNMIEPFDIMKDTFLLCDSEDEAKSLIKHYGMALSKKYLPKKYLYLIKE